MTERGPQNFSELNRDLFARQPIQAQYGVPFYLGRTLNVSLSNTEYLSAIDPKRDSDSRLVDIVPYEIKTDTSVDTGTVEIYDSPPPLSVFQETAESSGLFVVYPSLQLPVQANDEIHEPYAFLESNGQQMYSPLEYEGPGDIEGTEVFVSYVWKDSSHVQRNGELSEAELYLLSLMLFKAFPDEALVALAEK
jgi:hypothetical protein